MGETLIQVHPRLPCEHRRYTVKNLGKERAHISLLIYLEPCLAPAREAKAHPAFSKLFLEHGYDAGNKLQLFTRRPRGDGEPMCLAAGLLEDVPFTMRARGKNCSTSQTAFLLCATRP